MIEVMYKTLMNKVQNLKMSMTKFAGQTLEIGGRDWIQLPS